MNTKDVLGIPIFDGTIEDLIKIIIKEKPQETRCVSFSGAHGLVEAQIDNSFKAVLKSFYLNLADGMPLVWVSKLKGAKKITRSFGPFFFRECMKRTSNYDIKHFFCGGQEGVAESLKKAARVKFNNSNVIGTFTPPFKNVEEFDYQQIAKNINKHNPDVIWIGLSTPKQEKFALNLSTHVKASYIFSVGAAFDYFTNPNLKFAPRWMQRMGLEWFFRLLQEPRRLFKRYVKIVPLFIIYNFKRILK